METYGNGGIVPSILTSTLDKFSFTPRTLYVVQPVARHYTDWAIPDPHDCLLAFKYIHWALKCDSPQNPNLEE
jgi:hypothetical protein